MWKTTCFLLEQLFYFFLFCQKKVHETWKWHPQKLIYIGPLATYGGATSEKGPRVHGSSPSRSAPSRTGPLRTHGSSTTLLLPDQVEMDKVNWNNVNFTPQKTNMGGPPKIMVPPNHPFKNMVFHYLHHQKFGGFGPTPIFGSTSTCPLKINGWFRCIPYWNNPFLGDIRSFLGAYPQKEWQCLGSNPQYCTWAVFGGSSMVVWGTTVDGWNPKQPPGMYETL